MLLMIAYWLGYALLGVSTDTSGDALSLDMFHIARSRDAKTIHYSVRLTSDGQINEQNPLEILWEIPSQKGIKTQKLTWIQNKYAYGVEITEIKPESITFHFVSYEDKTIQIKKDTEGIYHAYTQCKGRSILLKDIYIQIDGGTFWVPKVSFVKLSGKVTETLEDTFEIIQP